MSGRFGDWKYKNECGVLKLIYFKAASSCIGALLPSFLEVFETALDFLNVNIVITFQCAIQSQEKKSYKVKNL